MKNRAFLTTLLLLSLPLVFGPPSYAQSRPTTSPTSRDSAQLDGCDKRGEQSVVLYDQPGFQGRPRYFGVGGCRLFNEADFNDQASSIKVPKGMVAVVYEHADEGGGFGEWVDFLEDQPDLSRYWFDKKISYVEVFPNTRGPLVYARNRIENGRFVKGLWVLPGGDSSNPDPVVSPVPKPPNVPVATTTPPPPARNPEQDLVATAERTSDNLVVGKLTNKSANAYPCVRTMVGLTRHGQAGGRPHDWLVGTSPVYLKNIKPHEVRDFRGQLPPLEFTNLFVKFIDECIFEDPENFPHVVYFTATILRIRRGTTVTLQWLSINSDNAVLSARYLDSPGSPHPLSGRPVAASGSFPVRPLRSTRYELEAKKGANGEAAAVIVEVIP